MKVAASLDTPRKGLLKRNLLLVATYIAAMLLIAVAYA